MSEEIDSGQSGANQLLLEMEHSDDSVALVPIAIEVVNANSLTLEQVVEFRREECKSSGHSLRDLRHRFADSIAEQARRLSGVRSPREEVEIRRQFREDVRDDYLALRDALKLEAKQVLGSKEIVAAALVSLAQIGAGLFTIPDEFSKLSFAASTVAIGGLYSSKSKFAQTRRKILEEHPTSYLYEAQGRLRL